MIEYYMNTKLICNTVHQCQSPVPQTLLDIGFLGTCVMFKALLVEGVLTNTRNQAFLMW